MNCEKWSNKKIKVWYYLISLIYFTLTVLAPSGIIIWKYKLFQKGGGLEISGGLLIVFIVVFFTGLKKFKKWIDRYQAESIKEKRFKFTMQGLYSLAFPIMLILMLYCLKDDFKLGFSACKYIMAFIIASIVLDYTILKYIEDERTLRKEAQHKVNVERRAKYAED